jgi:tight adherence protein B
MIAIVVLSLVSAAAVHASLVAETGASVRRRLPATSAVAVRHRVTWLDAALARAAAPIMPSTARRAWMAGGAVLVAGGMAAGGPHLAIVVVVAATAGPPLALRMLRGRADQLVAAALPDSLDAVARSLRSGGSLRQSVEEAATAARGPLADDLGGVVDRLRHGVRLEESLDAWAGARPLPGVRLATSALALGAETGGASAQAIDGVAATLRINLAIAGEVRALSSQARLSALVIALAPIGFAVFAATTDSSTATFLLRTPIGLTCLVVGLGLDLAGGLWMRRLAVVEA